MLLNLWVIQVFGCGRKGEGIGRNFSAFNFKSSALNTIYKGDSRYIGLLCYFTCEVTNFYIVLTT